MFFPEIDHSFNKTEASDVFIQKFPIEPSDFIIQPVGIVVAFLRAQELIAAEQHRHSLTQHQSKDEVFRLPNAFSNDAGIVGLAFAAEVYTKIFGGAVAAVMSVFVIVLFIIANKVVQGETVVSGDKIDAV